MVTGRKVYENFVECLPNDPLIGELVRQGGTIFRDTERGVVLVVPNGKSHSDVWRLAWGDSR